ncbi:MAG: MoxR family ATPase [Solobacterium sp.]|nr:MoxR family ATPase [Solobacterium sp.]
MHIRQAKTQIKNAVIAYNTKDKTGRYMIPARNQRPVFLIGAPGIGKTAIVEQIAQELDLAFVSYAMTHHTRQSALGLPYIVEKEYGGRSYSVSEYTMSEIIASVYEEMEKTHKTQGILFLDEINCVSETLAPSMLQFLQYKTFGRHTVPDGWIVVTAGNPAEYNDSVREYDIAMLDRLKKIEVEPDLEVWREFAVETGVHEAILSYLQIRPQHFYRVSMTVDGKSFVTARSWDDMSQMIKLYEFNGIRVDHDLIAQYLQDEQIAKDFANYYDLYKKYESDYQVEDILKGTASAAITERAQNASFDERLSLISLILSTLEERTGNIVIREEALRTVIKEIKEINGDADAFIDERIGFYVERMLKTDTKDNADLAYRIRLVYEQLKGKEDIRAELRGMVAKLKERSDAAQDALANLFGFFERCFGAKQEMVILVSELTVRPHISKYIYAHGCPKYYEYNKSLLFDEKNRTLNERIDSLDLPEA